jgi:hypothetical protein
MYQKAIGVETQDTLAPFIFAVNYKFPARLTRFLWVRPYFYPFGLARGRANDNHK